MQIVLILIIFLFFNISPVFAKNEILFDNPIEYINKTGCTLSEFCKKFLDDINVEKFIKEELENDYVVISLDECLDIALKNNFDIKIEYHTYQSSRYEYQNALSKFLPILTTSSYINDFRGQFLVGGVLRDDFHETALSSNFTIRHDLTQGGRYIYEAKAKKYFSKAQKHKLNYSRNQVLYYTVKYYYDTLFAKLNVEIFLRNLIERNVQLTKAQALFEVGYGSKFDVTRSESESAQAKVRLLEALKSFRIAQSNLANILGIDINTALMPFESDVKKINLVDEATPIDDLFNIALINREDFKEFKDLIDYEKQLKKVLYTEFIPKPYIDYQGQFQGTLGHSVKPNYIMSLTIDWMPGENFGIGTYTKIKAQREQIKIKELEYIKRKREVKQNLIESHATSEFNNKAIEESKKRVKYALESIDMAMTQFTHGEGTWLDIIQAQTELTEARLEQVNAIVQYNIAQMELLYYSGQMSAKTIVDNYKP